VVKNKYLCTTNQEIHNTNTGSNINLHPPMCILPVFQNGAYFSGIKLFNHLPLKIRSLSNDIKSYKLALRRFLNLYSIYSVEEYLEYSYNLDSWFLNKNQWNCIYNSSLIILNCIEYSKYCTLVIHFDTNLCQATTKMITIFLICMIMSCFVLDIFNYMTISISLWLL
jgi:hypothetical protein